jgi:hypothetical protein
MCKSLFKWSLLSSGGIFENFSNYGYLFLFKNWDIQFDSYNINNKFQYSWKLFRMLLKNLKFWLFCN